MKNILKQPSVMAFTLTALVFTPLAVMVGDWWAVAGLPLFAILTVLSAGFPDLAQRPVNYIWFAVFWGVCAVFLFMATFQNLGVLGMISACMAILSLVYAVGIWRKPGMILD